MREEWEEAFIYAAGELGKRAPAARAVDKHPDTVRHHMRRDQSFKARVERALGGARRIGTVLALLLVLAVPCAATITSGPVDLGAASLTVTVGLRHWQESAPNSWPTAPTSGVTINDLGGGLYTVSGLPAATGADRYAVTLTAGSVSLATYTYGAQPGTRVVWQQELDLPAAPTSFKAGDTFGSIAVVVRRRLPAAACDGGTTATFTAANAQTNVALLTDQPAVISNCALDATTGSYGAEFTYDFAPANLATVGKYLGEFTICYAPGSCQTVPTDNRLQFSVVKRLGG